MKEQDTDNQDAYITTIHGILQETEGTNITYTETAEAGVSIEVEEGTMRYRYNSVQNHYRGSVSLSKEGVLRPTGEAFEENRITRLQTVLQITQYLKSIKDHCKLDEIFRLNKAEGEETEIEYGLDAQGSPYVNMYSGDEARQNHLQYSLSALGKIVISDDNSLGNDFVAQRASLIEADIKRSVEIRKVLDDIKAGEKRTKYADSEKEIRLGYDLRITYGLKEKLPYVKCLDDKNNVAYSASLDTDGKLIEEGNRNHLYASIEDRETKTLLNKLQDALKADAQAQAQMAKRSTQKSAVFVTALAALGAAIYYGLPHVAVLMGQNNDGQGRAA